MNIIKQIGVRIYNNPVIVGAVGVVATGALLDAFEVIEMASKDSSIMTAILGLVSIAVREKVSPVTRKELP